MTLMHTVPQQVRQRVDIDNVRVLSVDKMLLCVAKIVPSSSCNNDQPQFTSRITCRRLPHKHRLRTPAY